jgi:uncharacterized membrane protein YccC
MSLGEIFLAVLVAIFAVAFVGRHWRDIRDWWRSR